MKKRGKKAQVASEHLIVIGLVLVVLIPTTYLLVTYNAYSSDAVKASKLESAANEIVKAANNLYSYGTESKTTMEISIPEGVQSIYFSDKEIIFNYITSSGGISQLAKAADVDLFGTTIENPVPGTLQLELKNLNLNICVALASIGCPLCPGVEVCDVQFWCRGDSDDICPNEYFPENYNGATCTGIEGEDCYDPDCVCTTGTGENGCNGGTCVEGTCGSCGLFVGWEDCSINSLYWGGSNYCCSDEICTHYVGGCPI